MNLSKILKAIFGRTITPKTYDKPEPASAARATYHATPIYDSYCTIPYRAFNPSWKFRLPATNHNCEFLLPVISRPIPSPPALPSPESTLRGEQHAPSSPSSPLPEVDRQTLELAESSESVAGAPVVSPALEVTRTNDQPVYELSAYRTPTETVSSRTQSEVNTTDNSIRNDDPESRNERQSFEEELRRLSNENEQQQCHIYELVARLTVAERKAQELAGGSRLTRQRKLRVNISTLIEELQTKESEVQQWAARYSSALQKAQINKDDEAKELVTAIKVDMETSNNVLQNLCGYLENRVQDIEERDRMLDRRVEGIGVYWNEEHFETALLQRQGASY